MYRNQYDTDVTTFSPAGRIHQVWNALVDVLNWLEDAWAKSFGEMVSCWLCCVLLLVPGRGDGVWMRKHTAKLKLNE